MGLFRWLASVFTRRPKHAELTGLLELLRAHGVTEYESGSLRLVFRLDLEPVQSPLPALEAAERAASDRPMTRELREPTADELLYGVDGYGLGLGNAQ